jgi:WD40 repeat protein
MLAVQLQSTHPVSHVAFSPDGTTIAIAQPHAGVTLCDRASGQALVAMPVPRAGELASVVFCDGGRKLAASFLKGLFLFDTATGTAIAQHGGWTLANAMLAATADGLLALNYHGLREVRLPQARGEPFRLVSRPLTTRSARVALSPCGRWVFGVYERISPSLTSTATGKFAISLDHPYRHRYHERLAVAFAADGSRLAVCDGHDIAVYDTPGNQKTGDRDQETEDGNQETEGRATLAPKPRELLKPVFRLAPPEDYKPAPRARLDFVDEGAPENPRWYPQFAFTPEGRGLLVRRPRNRVQLWDVATRSHAAEWSWRLEVTCLAVAPDGLTAVAGGRFGRAVVWDLE